MTGLGDGDRPLTVCIVTGEFVGLPHSGGIGTAMTGLACCLAEAGHNVTVLYTRGFMLTPRRRRALADAWATRAIAFECLTPQRLSRYAGPLQEMTFTVPSAVLDFLCERSFDAVHFNDMEADGFLALASKHHRLRFHDTTMGVALHSPRCWIDAINGRETATVLGKAMDAAERVAVATGDLLWSPSQYLLDWIVAHGFTLPGRVLVQPYVLPPMEASEPMGSSDPRGQLTREPSDALSRLVFFGRLERRKGLLLFLDAIDIVADELRRSGVSVLFLGQDTELDGRRASDLVRERARTWGLAVSFQSGLGQPEALALLSKPGSLAVMASPADNSPCTVYEAMERRIPFVAASTGGIPELIAEADHAQTLFAPDPVALAGTLRRALAGKLPVATPRQSQAMLSAQWRAHHAAGGAWHPRPTEDGGNCDVTDSRPTWIAVIGEGGSKAARAATLTSLKQLSFPPQRVVELSPPHWPRSGERRDRSAVGVSPCAVLFVQPGIVVESEGIEALLRTLGSLHHDVLCPSVTMGHRRADAPALNADVADVFGFAPTGIAWLRSGLETEVDQALASDTEAGLQGVLRHLFMSGRRFAPFPLVVGQATSDALRLSAPRSSAPALSALRRRLLIFRLLSTPLAPLVPHVIATGRFVQRLKVLGR